MSPCRPPQGQVGTGRVGTTGGWLRAGPGGQPHCTPSLALISAQCGAHSSRTALGVTRHASGHQTGSSFHLVQLWRGASGLTLPPLGRGPVPAWSEAVARSQTLPPLLPVHRPFYRTSCSRKWSPITQVTQGLSDSTSVSSVKALIILGLQPPDHVTVCEPQEGCTHLPRSLQCPQHTEGAQPTFWSE